MGEKNLLFNEELILLELKATDWEEALNKMSENLFEQKIVKESFKNAVVNREKEFSTGLQSSKIGVAIPHTDAEHVNVQAISVAVLDKPVSFVHMGTADLSVEVEVIFMLAIKEPEGQLLLLQKLMDVFQKEEVLEKIRQSKDKKEILEIVTNEVM